MKQFSLQEYLTNPSRKVVTKDGREVRIICTDRKAFEIEQSKKVIGLVDMCYCEVVKIWDEKGKYYDANTSSSFDLFFVPEQHEGWINLYKDIYDKGSSYIGNVYNSKEEAEKEIGMGGDYITTIKIEWED